MMITNKRTGKANSTSGEYKGRKFEAVVTEVYQRKILVSESEMKEVSAEEAVRMATDWWRDEQIILGTDDFQGIEVTAKEVTEHADDTGAGDTDGADAEGADSGGAGTVTEGADTTAADTAEGDEPEEEAQ